MKSVVIKKLPKGSDKAVEFKKRESVKVFYLLDKNGGRTPSVTRNIDTRPSA